MIFMGLTSASELAHMAYAYAKIRDRERYQRMTGIVRGTTLLGKCLSSMTAQIAVSYFHSEYGLLVYMSLAGNYYIYIFIMCTVHAEFLSAIWKLSFDSVQKKLFFFFIIYLPTIKIISRNTH